MVIFLEPKKVRDLVLAAAELHNYLRSQRSTHEVYVDWGRMLSMEKWSLGNGIWMHLQVFQHNLPNLSFAALFSLFWCWCFRGCQVGVTGTWTAVGTGVSGGCVRIMSRRGFKSFKYWCKHPLKGSEMLSLQTRAVSILRKKTTTIHLSCIHTSVWICLHTLSRRMPGMSPIYIDVVGVAYPPSLSPEQACAPCCPGLAPL